MMKPIVLFIFAISGAVDASAAYCDMMYNQYNFPEEYPFVAFSIGDKTAEELRLKEDVAPGAEFLAMFATWEKLHLNGVCDAKPPRGADCQVGVPWVKFSRAPYALKFAGDTVYAGSLDNVLATQKLLIDKGFCKDPKNSSAVSTGEASSSDNATPSSENSNKDDSRFD
ncbi:MAG: hypothetical protein A4S09_17500 [Proteobacteria bacterium SG_bin7]|nr:MAG: hypothetical protein A4S09_17500 [Proteobacteria bacterium SG_bin7]